MSDCELTQPAHGYSMPNKTYEKSENEMWSKYMLEAREYDKRVTDAWKEDASGVLVFTGLFSVIVGALIIESYKKLSPDPSDKTTFLLGQISQQLSGLGNGAVVQPQPYPSFSPDTRMIWVNIMWLLSLVLSLTSALFATLTQQWACRYIQLPELLSSQREQARVRSYLFRGMQKYNMRMLHAVETTPTLLHLSVFLFFVGLVIFFFSINKTVAIVVSVSVGLFALAYFALTILPCIAHDCPYRTPMSNIWWYIWHSSISFTSHYFHLLLKLVHRLLASPKGMNMSYGQQSLVSCIDFFEEVVERHVEHLKDGFWGSIIKGALKAPVEVEVEALRWLFKLPALADKSKAEEFVAGIPGEMVVRLMNASIWSRGIRFRDHLHTLLRSCASLTAGLDGKVRKHRLLICLDAIHYVARASITPNGVTPSLDVLSDLRINFANMGFMRMLWTDSDPAIRVTSRSICALLARYFLRKNPLMDSDLAWLQDVVGKSSNTIFCSLDNLPRVDSMNVDSFVHGILSNEPDDLPNEQVFVETLVVLMNAGSQTALNRGVFKAELSALLRRAEQDGHRLHVFLNKLHRIFEHFFSSKERHVTNAGMSVVKEDGSTII